MSRILSLVFLLDKYYTTSILVCMSNFNDLVKILHGIDSKEEMVNFLNGILTPKEKQELVMRLDIVKMLKRGIPHHEIAQKLGVGVATVTRGSKEIQNGNFQSLE